MTAPGSPADTLKLRLCATREDRTFTVESLVGGPAEAQARAQVARLRREHGFPLPAPDWEAADDDGVVLLCRAGDAAVGSVRLVHASPHAMPSTHAEPAEPATAGTDTADQLAGAAQAVIDGRVHLTSRTLDEYRLLFGLTDQDLLGGPVLDCPGGASSFAAESRALGAQVTSADPVYHLPPGELESLVRDHHEATAAFGLAIADQLDFSWAGSPERHLERWQNAADTFLQDFTVLHDFAADHGNPAARAYVPAALPELPFADRQFRISLCGFLLFTFPGAVDQEAAIRELVRVTEGEVLIGPLEDPLGSPCRTLDLLRTRLADLGITTAVREIGYSIHPVQRGVLVCRRSR
ncbi:hypothetical protein [Kitasatospora sp. NBC_01266]|uniref:hypothetical protein n=1 Tax=Kitasatospora sp. NBC_01266 TaxID=2903572 RepID=UPI002E301B0B|nr:hypothetical protein [Kitasatospora sp. NBC_01266]